MVGITSVRLVLLLMSPYLTFSLKLNRLYYYEAWKYETQAGKCPDYPAHPNFELDRFQGSWTVAHEFRTVHRFKNCQQLNITEKSGNSFSFKLKGSVRTGRHLRIKTKGQMIIPDVTQPAVMRWNWDYFPSMTDMVTVLDTDYDNYSVIILCHDYALFHTVYPILMTREKPLNHTKEYQSYFDRVLSVMPNPVFTYTDEPELCYLDTAYPDLKVKTLNVDKSMKQFSGFVSKFI